MIAENSPATISVNHDKAAPQQHCGAAFVQIAVFFGQKLFDFLYFPVVFSPLFCGMSVDTRRFVWYSIENPICGITAAAGNEYQLLSGIFNLVADKAFFLPKRHKKGTVKYELHSQKRLCISQKQIRFG